MSAPKGNTNAEKWTEEESRNFLEEAIKLSNDKKYDFIGEVAQAQESYKEVYNYLTDKYPTLKKLLKQLKSNCESNCFYNGKKGDIVPSLAIMNLKSNHGWTDRNTNIQKVQLEQPLFPDVSEDNSD